MAFPSSPTNGQTATINNIAYTYDSAKNAWTRQVITNINVSGNIVTTSTTTSTSSTTGALRVAGGTGIGGALYTGGIIDALGNIVADSGVASTSTTTGALIVNGGVGISGALFTGGIIDAGGNLIADSGTASTSTTTGALIVRGGAGVSGNVFTAGWIIPTSNVSQNLGTTTSWWNVFYGVSTQARYADLAENYQADNNYEPGTVLIFGGSHEVTISTLSHDISVAGVVSTNPAHLMNSALKGNNVIPLALQGRVPCQVRGPVKKGTLLVTSNIAGVAEACKDTLYKPGCVIGKSLAEILDNSIQLIEIVVGRV